MRLPRIHLKPPWRWRHRTLTICAVLFAALTVAFAIITTYKLGEENRKLVQLESIVYPTTVEPTKIHTKTETRVVGSRGTPGTAGARGRAGAQGTAGQIGATGATGARGLAGTQGPAGPRGLAGGRGPAGPRGPAGTPGARGPAGAPGPVGPIGHIGAPGPPPTPSQILQAVCAVKPLLCH